MSTNGQFINTQIHTMNHSLHTKLDDAINRLKVYSNYSKYPNVNLTEIIEKEIEILQDISDRLLLKELQD